MPFVILLLDSNYLTSAKHAPKKWNVNYITVNGLNEDELLRWHVEYGEEYTSVDSDLNKELAVIAKMLNTLENFGFVLISSVVSTPTISYKDKDNNRECYVWTLHKSQISSQRERSVEQSHA